MSRNSRPAILKNRPRDWTLATVVARSIENLRTWVEVTPTVWARIDLDALDPADREEWARQLRRDASTIRQLANLLAPPDDAEPLSCEQCGTTMSSNHNRADRRYCSGRCRQKAYRERTSGGG